MDHTVRRESIADLKRSLGKRWAETWRSGIVGAGGAVFLGLLFLLTPLGSRLAHSSYDLLLLLCSPAARPDEATVVYMDEASRTRLAQREDAPWHRTNHTRLLKRLTELGAKAVVFDVLFDDPWRQKVPNEPPAQADKVDVELGYMYHTSKSCT